MEENINKVKKVIIVGHPEISARMVHEAGLNEDVIIVDTKEDLSKLIGTDVSVLIPPNAEPLVFENMPRYTYFEPKLKHLHKGHERPYKYHR